jgi:hypothetical protein
MTESESPGKGQSSDDTALLIAALNHAWVQYDARINRGLQMINYFLVATAILATAYVSAINAKHYPIAAAIAVSEIPFAAAIWTYLRRQRHHANPAQRALLDLEARIADRLTMSTFRVAEPPGTATYSLSAFVFALVVLLSAGAVLYALVH